MDRAAQTNSGTCFLRGLSSISGYKSKIVFMKYSSSSLPLISAFSCISCVHGKSLCSGYLYLPYISSACLKKSIFNFCVSFDCAKVLSWKWSGMGSPAAVDPAIIVGKYPIFITRDAHPLILLKKRQRWDVLLSDLLWCYLWIHPFQQIYDAIGLTIKEHSGPPTHTSLSLFFLAKLSSIIIHSHVLYHIFRFVKVVHF